MTTRRPIDDIIGRGWREEYIHANGVRQHIWRTGGRGRVVVMLPGFQEIGLTWARVAKRVEDELDVIMVDFRGQGRTERGSVGYSQALLVADVAALLHELGVARASVIGFSNGAGVAAELAATYRDVVASVVLEDPPRTTGRTTAMGESPQYRAWHQEWLGWIERYQRMSAAEQLETVRSQISGGGSAWPNDELVPFAESYAQLDVELVREPGTLWKVANRSVANLLAEIQCPTLLIEATKAMPGAPPSTAPAPAGPPPPNVTRAAFDTSHFVRREAFDAYMAVVVPFLRAGHGH